VAIETAFTPWSAAAGGALIGVASVLLLAASGRIAGISRIVRRVVLPGEGTRSLEALAFIVGLILAPLLWQATGSAIEQTITDSLSLAAASGAIVGFGAALGGGCTSGHGVCGLSRFSLRSLVAVLTFMAAAAITVYVTRHILGVQ